MTSSLPATTSPSYLSSPTTPSGSSRQMRTSTGAIRSCRSERMDSPVKVTIISVDGAPPVAASIEPVPGGELLRVSIDRAEFLLEDADACDLFDAMRALQAVVETMQFVPLARLDAASPSGGQ